MRYAHEKDEINHHSLKTSYFLEHSIYVQRSSGVNAPTCCKAGLASILIRHPILGSAELEFLNLLRSPQELIPRMAGHKWRTGPAGYKGNVYCDIINNILPVRVH
jgi:hypothetical protein